MRPRRRPAGVRRRIEGIDYPLSPSLRARIADNLASHQPALLSAQEARHAAVGVVLVGDALGRACFVLTRRVATLRRHSGQWALPGGRLEPDEEPRQAALREISEEVGLDLGSEAVLGRLDDFLSRSGHLISPFVVWGGADRELRPNPDEVAAAYQVPLAELDAPDNPRTLPLLHFAVIGTTVYAPTAAILYQFRELALHGRAIAVAHFEQPFFAWR